MLKIIFKRLFWAFLFLPFSSTLFAHIEASSSNLKPGIMYGMGSKFDHSFNQAAYNGIERFKKETGIPYLESELSNPAQSEQFLRHMIKKGVNHIIIIGYDSMNALHKIATAHPELRFTLIDAVMDLPNVQSIIFKDEEGAFIVGALAALKTKTGKIGFIGGMDIPVVKRFSCGYLQGARYINKDIIFYENMIGTTMTAWSDPIKAAELAKSQYERGVDIIYTAAGKSALGILQTAAEMDKFAIGTDVNQNYLFPGHVLTSMEKKVDRATYQTLIDSYTNKWRPGIRHLGLKDKALSWSLDEHNAALITDSINSKLQNIRQKIIKGDIKVVDYVKNNHCPLS